MSQPDKIAGRAEQRLTAATAVARGLATLGGISSPFLFLCLLALALLLASERLQAQQQRAEAGVQLEAGIEKEDVIGDLKSAIEIYQKIAADNLASRDVRARALL